MAQAVSAISATFPGIDRDVAVTGALLHDVGKVEAYTEDPRSIDFTDVGRLHGEIALGYYRIRRTIEEIEGFPAELGRAVGHIILSHHGSLEHGSPVVPCTREATLVHMIDNLGGRLGSFDRLEKELAAGERWSGFDRAIGSVAHFAGRAQPLEPVREAARCAPVARRGSPRAGLPVPPARASPTRVAQLGPGTHQSHRLFQTRSYRAHRGAARSAIGAPPESSANSGADGGGGRVSSSVSPGGSIFGDGWRRTPRS